MHIFIDTLKLFHPGIKIYIEASEVASLIASETGKNKKTIFRFLRDYSNLAIRDLEIGNKKFTFTTDPVVRIALSEYTNNGKQMTPRLAELLSLMRDIEDGQKTLDQLIQELTNF